MRFTSLFLIAMFAGVLVLGCIVSDEVTTLTISPDGSADWIKFQSNIRSTEAGEKGAQELKKFTDEFNSRSSSEFVRIADSGGEVREARWLRDVEPYSSVEKVRFPTAAALEKFGTIKNDQGEVIAPVKFTADGRRRRISMVIPIPSDETPSTQPTPTFQEWRDQLANGISETRVAVVGGKIMAAQGFVISNDRRSCLLDSQKINELLRARPKEVELFIAWELDGE